MKRPRNTPLIMAGARQAPTHIAGRMELRALAPRSAGEPDAELLIYGDIGESWYGDSVTALRVVRELQALQATHILVRINSYGGSVTDGLSIYNALRAHTADITTRVEGIAASIASLIAMAGDTLQIYSNATLMIHAPWTIAIGNSADMRELADVLDTYAAAMATSYARKTGKPLAEVEALLTDGQDHYYTATQAIDQGWADALADPPDEDETAAQSRLQPVFAAVNRYRAPAAIAASAGLQRFKVPPLAAPRPATTAAPAAPRNNQESRMNWRALAGALGIDVTAAADETAVRELIARHFNLAATATDDDIANAVAAARAPPATAAAPAAAAAPTAAERVRNILAAALLGQPQNQELTQLRSLANVNIAAGVDMDVETVRTQVIALMSNNAEAAVPGNYVAGTPRTSVVQDAREKLVIGATAALEARAGLRTREAGNEYNGMSLPDVAAQCLRAAGIDVRGMTRDGIARRVLGAMSTSDFPQITSNVAGRALRAAYEAFPHTYNRWCAVGEVSDFKAHPRIQMGSFNSLAVIPEGGEYTFGDTKEESETITAATKGKAIKLTRQLIVNDDLGAFMRRAQMLGRAAGRTVNSDVYALLTSASAAGPTMSDGGAMFNSTAVTTAGGHANLAGSGGAIAVTTVAAGRAAMRMQKDASLRDTLNIMPRFMLAPVGKEDIAWALLNSTADPASSNSAKANYVRSQANLELVTDPYLDGVSATGWYLVADPMDAALIEVDFLDGQQTPYIDEAIEFMSDCLVLKARLDYGLSGIDWRAGYRNPGA